jgi:hypothetical protein
VIVSSSRTQVSSSKSSSRITQAAVSIVAANTCTSWPMTGNRAAEGVLQGTELLAQKKVHVTQQRQVDERT